MDYNLVGMDAHKDTDLIRETSGMQDSKGKGKKIANYVCCQIQKWPTILISPGFVSHRRSPPSQLNPALAGVAWTKA
jgi:hypothetical protein